jgi:hypothetical protein
MWQVMSLLCLTDTVTPFRRSRPSASFSYFCMYMAHTFVFFFFVGAASRDSDFDALYVQLFF